MKRFTKENKGNTLEILIDDVSLLSTIDGKIKEYQDLKPKYEELEREQNEDFESLRWDYDMQLVYGDYMSDFCTPDEIIKDLEDFKQIILDAASGSGSELFDIIPLKKNGTFKKTCKPTLKEAINGTYWEDSYGWNTMVLRLEPQSDTTASMILSNIVSHY